MIETMYVFETNIYLIHARIHKLHEAADSAEALMRARYSAHVLGEIDFIMETVHPKLRSGHSAADIRAWAEQTSWLKLEVLECLKGTVKDNKGIVEFKAYFLSELKQSVHHERSNFERLDNKWYYVDGVTPKVGRNHPCTCGSGKKYKKCCGK